jgi:flagellar hook-associated protein 3 FlgL
MTIRPTQASTFSQAQRGLLLNFAKLTRAQQQVATGKRILQPSDDPIGSTLAMAFRRAIAGSERYGAAIQSARTAIDTAAGRLQEGAGILSEARSLLIQGMNGPTNQQDRALLAGEIELIRESMLDIANSRLGSRYLFAGTDTQDMPFTSRVTGGLNTVAYAGNDEAHQVLVAQETRMETLIAGAQIFAREERTGTAFAGLTGLTNGSSADQGTGYEFIEIRHDTTSGALPGGLAFVNAGAQDTIMGDHTLTVDSTAGTIQLDNGTVVRLPQPTDPDYADFTVTSDGGAELHLDFTAFTGATTATTVRGDGSISLDGSTYVPLTLGETNLELLDPATNAVVHVDATGVHRAGRELATFGGTVNVFDVLQGIVDDLNNPDGLSSADLQDRLGLWLGELDRNQDNVLTATGTLGARSQRLTRMEDGLAESTLQVQGLLSQVEDADFSQVVLDMTRAEQTLQLAQATSVRLLNTSLLNFLR